MSPRERILVIALASVIVVSGGYFGYQRWSNNHGSKQAATPTPTSALPTPTVAATPTAIPEVTPIVDEGVTWINPVKMKNLQLLKGATQTYYHVANLTGGGKIIDLFYQEMGVSLYRFRYEDGKYYILSKHSADIDNQSIADKVQYDSKTVYSGITTPSSVIGDNIKYYGGDYYYSTDKTAFFSSLKDAVQVTTTLYGRMYRTDSKLVNPITTTAKKTVYVEGINIRRSYLKSADTTIPSYNVKIKILKDDNVADVTFNDGKKNKDIYVDRFSSSCGGAEGRTIIKKDSAMVSDLVENGTATNGDKIYTITNSSNSLLKLAYDEYKMNREAGALLTYAQFIAKKPLMLWQDEIGDYQALMNEKYGVLAECGKPVIYLYPEQPTQVTVRLGARIRVSDPTYQNGWKVLAMPNGQLKLDGRSYPYLFWEGLGNGVYPAITSGIVVKRVDLHQTLINQMTQLGLNSQEQTDFMDFWWPRMPNKPYVRLTWLGTTEMNRLAPLSVNPKPATMIRVFLDFDGLDQPIELQPQKLWAPQRRGFTLVEWGGLLK